MKGIQKPDEMAKSLMQERVLRQSTQTERATPTSKEASIIGGSSGEIDRPEGWQRSSWEEREVDVW